MNTLDELKEATKRKKVPLFFIKSKHVRPTYKNHPYFNANSSIPHTSLNHRSINKQYVNTPTDYGMNNTFKYLFQKTVKSGGGGEMETLDQKQIRKGRVNTEPSNYFKVTQSYLYRSKRLKTIEDDSWKKVSQQLQTMPSDFVELIFTQRQNGFNNKIVVDIFPFVVKCFLKCKIKFDKIITESQYVYIKWAINEVRKKPKKYFDYKNIVNMDSIQQIFQELERCHEGSVQWIQIVRFFFVPTEEVFKYQFFKLIDKVKQATVLKFNIEVQNQNIFLYRADDKVKINSLYDMFDKGTYVYGLTNDSLDKFSDMVKRKKNFSNFENRVKRWKSVAPLDESWKEVKKSEKSKYLKLNSMFKERYEKRKNSRKITELTLNSSSFIDKSKFHKEQDIFE